MAVARSRVAYVALGLLVLPACAAWAAVHLTAPTDSGIKPIDPPEKGFYARVLDYEGIPIKAPAVVDDRALLVARERLSRMLKNLPDARYNLRLAGAELHIIGKDQV